MTDCRTLLGDRGICVLIPTYNNAATLEGVVRSVLKYCADVIVVNDGSTDSTSGILDRLPEVTVVSHTENRGKGSALKTGFRKALEMGFSYAITMDSDGQHFAKDIEILLHANMDNPGALIVGERVFNDADRTKGSTFANRFSNFWFTVQTGLRLNDTQTGFRLYPLKKLPCLGLLTSRYEAELELLVFAAWSGVRIVPAKVDVYYPPKEERVSHFRPCKDFVRISVLNTVLCVLAVVYGLPAALWRVVMTFLRTAYTLITFSLYCFLFAVPVSRLYFKLVRSEEKHRRFIHNMIYRFSKTAVSRFGIPGASFSCTVDDPSVFDKPHIIICNHQSHLDLVCLLSLKREMVCVTNAWAWNNPFYGSIIRKAGYIPVIDEVESLIRKAEAAVESGCSIVAFPEGTRSADCRIARFHKGAFHLAEQLGLDILPVYLYGTGQVLPKRGRHLNKGRMHVEVGTVITRDELEAMGGLRDQAKTVRKIFMTRYDGIKNRIDSGEQG